MRHPDWWWWLWGLLAGLSVRGFADRCRSAFPWRRHRPEPVYRWHVEARLESKVRAAMQRDATLGALHRVAGQDPRANDAWRLTQQQGLAAMQRSCCPCCGTMRGPALAGRAGICW